jgi:hypothetical protein
MPGCELECQDYCGIPAQWQGLATIIPDLTLEVTLSAPMQT